MSSTMSGMPITAASSWSWTLSTNPGHLSAWSRTSLTARGRPASMDDRHGPDWAASWAFSAATAASLLALRLREWVVVLGAPLPVAVVVDRVRQGQVAGPQGSGALDAGSLRTPHELHCFTPELVRVLRWTAQLVLLQLPARLHLCRLGQCDEQDPAGDVAAARQGQVPTKVGPMNLVRFPQSEEEMENRDDDVVDGPTAMKKPTITGTRIRDATELHAESM
jgi:hypothetical protein